MTRTLIITSRPDGSLTYDDNDIVQVFPGDQHPGNAVVPTESGFLFCYISDKDSSDPEVLALMDPLEGPPEDSGDPDAIPELLEVRRYQAALVGDEFRTWVPQDQAADAGIEMTWADFQDLITDKGA